MNTKSSRSAIYKPGLVLLWYIALVLWLGGLLCLLATVPMALRHTQLAPLLARDMLLEVGYWQLWAGLIAIVFQLLLLVIGEGAGALLRDRRGFLLWSGLLLSGFSLGCWYGHWYGLLHLSVLALIVVGLWLLTYPAPGLRRPIHPTQ